MFSIEAPGITNSSELAMLAMSSAAEALTWAPMVRSERCTLEIER